MLDTFGGEGGEKDGQSECGSILARVHAEISTLIIFLLLSVNSRVEKLHFLFLSLRTDRKSIEKF